MGLAGPPWTHARHSSSRILKDLIDLLEWFEKAVVSHSKLFLMGIWRSARP
jgi:hypothetical protein